MIQVLSACLPLLPFSRSCFDMALGERLSSSAEPDTREGLYSTQQAGGTERTHIGSRAVAV